MMFAEVLRGVSKWKSDLDTPPSCALPAGCCCAVDFAGCGDCAFAGGDAAEGHASAVNATAEEGECDAACCTTLTQAVECDVAEKYTAQQKRDARQRADPRPPPTWLPLLLAPLQVPQHVGLEDQRPLLQRALQVQLRACTGS